MAVHWNALLIFDQIFRTGNQQFADQYDLGTLFKVAYLHTDGRYTIEEIFRSTDPFFDVDLQPKADVSPLNFPDNLTCRALEECTAFLNQREFYANADALLDEAEIQSSSTEEMKALHGGRMESYREDPSQLYVACLDYFVDSNTGLDVNDTGALWALQVIIDLALNPPVPPFCDFESRFSRDAASSLTMADLIQLHPVSRFMLLVDAINAAAIPSDVMRATKDRVEFAEFGEKLCRNAGLPYPEHYLQNSPILDDSPSVWTSLVDSPSQYLKAHLLRHHKLSCDIRVHRPSSFAVPAHNLLYDQDFIPYVDLKRYSTLFLNPLQIISGTGYFSGIADEEYWKVLAAAGYNMALTSLLSPNGTFFNAGLPTDDLHFSMVEKARDSLISRLRN